MGLASWRLKLRRRRLCYKFDAKCLNENRLRLSAICATSLPVEHSRTRLSAGELLVESIRKLASSALVN
jgi:hypothetical protein